jgi:hypothetical protein
MAGNRAEEPGIEDQKLKIKKGRRVYRCLSEPLKLPQPLPMERDEVPKSFPSAYRKGRRFRNLMSFNLRSILELQGEIQQEGMQREISRQFQGRNLRRGAEP